LRRTTEDTQQQKNSDKKATDNEGYDKDLSLLEKLDEREYY
jgi:hypothetical protein